MPFNPKQIGRLAATAAELLVSPRKISVLGVWPLPSKFLGSLSALGGRGRRGQQMYAERKKMYDEIPSNRRLQVDAIVRL